MLLGQVQTLLVLGTAAEAAGLHGPRRIKAKRMKTRG